MRSRVSDSLARHIFPYLYFYFFRIYLSYAISVFLLFDTYISIFVSFPFFIKYIYIFVTLFCSVWVIAFAFSSLGLAARIKRITSFCQILRGAAGLISRFEWSILDWCDYSHLAPFLKYCCCVRIVLFIAYCIVFVIASSRFPRHVSSCLHFVHRNVPISKFLKSSRIVSI